MTEEYMLCPMSTSRSVSCNPRGYCSGVDGTCSGGGQLNGLKTCPIQGLPTTSTINLICAKVGGKSIGRKGLPGSYEHGLQTGQRT